MRENVIDPKVIFWYNKEKDSHRKMPQTITQTTSGALSLYDEIMIEIEPDLTSANYPEILEWMKSESESEKNERMKHYKVAFAECEKRLKERLSRGKAALVKAKHMVLVGQEKKSLKADATSLQNLENEFQAS